MSSKVHIKVFDAKNVLNIDNIPSNPYLKFNLKGKSDSVVKTKTIYNTLNPSWDQELDIVSDDYNNDILQVCMYTEDKENDYPLSNIYEYPLRYHSLGEHFVFNDVIEMQKSNAGILHYELDFFIYPEIPLVREQPPDQDNQQPAPENLQTNIIQLKRENDQIKAQFQDVATENAQKISEIQEDLLALKKENEKLLQTIQEKSDTIIENDKKDSNNFFITTDEESQNYETSQMINDGRTSILYKVVNKKTGKTVCKRLFKIDKKTTTLKDVEDVINEFKVIYSLVHPCICEAIGINTSEIVKSDNDGEVTTISMFFEFCPNSLKNLLQKQVIDNTLKTRSWLWMNAIVCAISITILVFSVLKIDNILLNSIFELKLVNYGILKIEEILLFSKSENDIFSAPELLAGKEAGTKSDVYSFGVILFYIFTGKVPEIQSDDKSKGQIFDLPEASPSISEFCVELISKCIAANPDKRPTFDEIIANIKSHSFALASDIDLSIIAKRDDELTNYDLKK